MRHDPLPVALRALAEAATRPHDVATLALVRDSLVHRSNHVVGRAARAAREADLTALAPGLVAAFSRFLEDPVRRDPGCVAKTEIVRALLSFGYAESDVFLRAATHVQREPAFGPPIDTAPELPRPAPWRSSPPDIPRRSPSVSICWSIPNPPPGRGAFEASRPAAAPTSR